MVWYCTDGTNSDVCLVICRMWESGLMRDRRGLDWVKVSVRWECAVTEGVGGM